ncbi:MAG: hypothetical protein AAAFM81_07595 [Pseudomonadota bacterium]
MMSDITSSQWLKRTAATLIVALTAACGGGGGGGGGTAPPPVNNAPNVFAGDDQSVARNVVVTLDGTASDDGGAASISYTWTQTAGTAVTLTGADTADATFTSPDVAADETLQFTLTATDAQGASADDTVAVTVIFDVPPTVAVGDDRNVQQNTSVDLTGTATDDNDIAQLTYQWVQIAGTPVTLDNATAAQASFTAPATSGVQILEFRLTVTDASGQTSVDDIVITVFEDINASTVSGKVEFEFVPFANNALNYAQQEMRPVRGATIQLIDATTNDVIDSTTLDDQGDYLFVAPASTNVFLRVRAELKRSGSPSWDVEVRDNTSSTSEPLASRPIYVLDGVAFDSGVGSQVVNLQADSGWTGASYTQTRAAAPFSVLDTIYRAMQLVTSVDPDANFPPLDAYWSVNNTPNVGGNTNIDIGEIGTSFYRGDLDSLFLLGEANSDTEEFDTHVVAHEWGHYFEDTFSRSDSTGGSHSLSQRLDPRLAFGEGFGNAVSAMIMGTPVYFDTQGSQQSSGFSFSLEDSGLNSTSRGWYNERSVQAVLYDIFDSNDDLSDSVTLGFEPIYEILVNEQAAGAPFTTIYPFIESLRARYPANVVEIDALLDAQRITGDNDAYGTNEVEAAGRRDVVLPIYSVVTPDDAGGPVNVCSTNVFDPDEDGNKLSVRRFVRIPVTTAGNYTVNIVTSNPPASGQSDPDAFVFRGDFVGGGDSPVADSETFQLNNLTPGDYVMVLYEFSYLRGGPAAITQPDNRTCFDVSVTS